MIPPSTLKEAIEIAIPDAEVSLEDLTGTADHYRVEVRSAMFAALPLIEQHKLVNQALQQYLDDGSLHALSIKTLPLTE